MLIYTDFKGWPFTIKNRGMVLRRLEFTVKIFLFTSYPEGFGLEPKPRITPYHQVFLSPSEEVKDRKEEGLPSLSDGAFSWVFHAGVGSDSNSLQYYIFPLIFPK